MQGLFSKISEFSKEFIAFHKDMISENGSISNMRYVVTYTVLLLVTTFAVSFLWYAYKLQLTESLIVAMVTIIITVITGKVKQKKYEQTKIEDEE